MPNGLLFILSALVDILFIFIASRRGIEWLFGTIVINLILVGIFGAKLIMIFGFTTNAGNIFYACVFLATHFIIERNNKYETQKIIRYGLFSLFLFTILAELATKINGIPSSVIVNEATQTLFSFSLRITIASVIAYIFAQYINITIFQWLKVKTKGKFLWLRVNSANILAQLVDSLLFFSIAFFDLAGPMLLQAILAGWLIKIFVVAIGTPFIYLDQYLKNKKL